MSDVLAKICEDKRRHIEAQRRNRPLSDLEAEAKSAEPPRAFARALREAVTAGRYGLIAEIKLLPLRCGLQFVLCYAILFLISFVQL